MSCRGPIRFCSCRVRVASTHGAAMNLGLLTATAGRKSAVSFAERRFRRFRAALEMICALTPLVLECKSSLGLGAAAAHRPLEPWTEVRIFQPQFARSRRQFLSAIRFGIILGESTQQRRAKYAKRAKCAKLVFGRFGILGKFGFFHQNATLPFI